MFLIGVLANATLVNHVESNHSRILIIDSKSQNNTEDYTEQWLLTHPPTLNYSLALCSSFQPLWVIDGLFLSTCFSLIHSQSSCVCVACQSLGTWHTLSVYWKKTSIQCLAVVSHASWNGLFILGFLTVAQVIQYKPRAFMNLLGQSIKYGLVKSIFFYFFLLPVMHFGWRRQKFTRKSTCVGSEISLQASFGFSGIKERERRKVNA